MACRCRSISAGRIRLGTRLLRATDLPPRRAAAAWLATGGNFAGGHGTFSDRCNCCGQPPAALSPLRDRCDYEGRCVVIGVRDYRLVGSATALAALRRDIAEWG